MPSSRLALGAVFVGLSAVACGGRADPGYEAAVVRSVERDVAEIQRAAPAHSEAARSFHHFEPGMLKTPVRPIDSRAGRIFTPTAILAELGSGEKIVICALSEGNYHVYRLAPFAVSWKSLCPHDLNFVATPPDGRPPPGGR